MLYGTSTADSGGRSQNKATLRGLAQSRIMKILICTQCNHGEDATVSIIDPATDY